MNSKEITVVTFGDSLTALTPGVRVASEQMQTFLSVRHERGRVFNAGVRGNHTDLALARFERDVLSHDPDLVFIMFGTNDAAIDVSEGKTTPRVPLERYLANLSAMTAALRERNSIPVLMTPLPMTMTGNLRPLYDFPPYSERGFNVLLEEYVGALRELAARQSVGLIDHFTAFTREFPSSAALEAILPDGMHPGQAGHDRIARPMIALLHRQLFNTNKHKQVSS